MKSFAPQIAWLKEALINLLKLIKGLFLTALAIFLLLLAVPIAAIHYLCTIWGKKQEAREILTNYGGFFYLVALALDHLGNVLCPSLFNWLFLKNKSVEFRFGVPGQSISLILGWNDKDGNLKKRGEWLEYVLDLIDPNHCQKAVEQSLIDARNYLETARIVQDRIEFRDRQLEFQSKYN